MRTTRRTFLGGIAAASVPTGAAVAALQPEAQQDENPELLAAYDRFLAARAEVAAAEDALEWLVDEWRHRWPSAPEAILGGANADSGAGDWGDTAERDIAGRFIRRETAGLTNRMTRKMRERMPFTCFSVETPEYIAEVIRRWEHPRSGRTPAALARNIAEQQRVLAKYRAKLSLSEAYHAETARLREASGVEKCKQRLHVARIDACNASRAASNIEAFTPLGIVLKAKTITSEDAINVFRKQEAGILGEMTRFIDATLAVLGRTSV